MKLIMVTIKVTTMSVGDGNEATVVGGNIYKGSR